MTISAAPARMVALFIAISLLPAAEPVRARRAMVVSGETHATDTGLAVLRSGGNAYDAAVAIGFVLAVTHPAMCGLGGGGHALIRTAGGRVTFFDFRERAPGRATRNMFLDPGGNPSPDSVTGWRAAAVPGHVKGLEMLHRKFGRKGWAELVRPAIELARTGHALSYGRATALRNARNLALDPESKRVFLNGGRHYEPGDTLLQPDLARALERIAGRGAKEFYEGETARRLAAEMDSHGGLITLADLKQYDLSEREPLTGRYRGYDILTASGSSAGGFGLLQMLGILEGSGFEKHGSASAAAIHLMVEAMRRSFADRSEYYGDPDFVKVPMSKLLDKAYLAQQRASVDPGHATSSESLRPATARPRSEGTHTTHYAAVDAEGNAVAVTITLNGMYGSGVTVPGLGFLLNNNMDNFATRPGRENAQGLRQSEANAIQPGKRPVSSMTPTMLLRDGKLYMVVGTPGGPTIPNSVLQAIVNVVDFGMNAQDAVNAPRVHHQWVPDRLFVEPGFSPDTLDLLRRRGHTIQLRPSNNDLNMIVLDAGWFHGAVDSRRAGKAAGF